MKTSIISWLAWMGAALLLWCGLAPPAIAAPVWSYQGATDPAHWAELSPDYRVCASGQQQSPINLDIDPKPMAGAITPVIVNYSAAPVTLQDTGRTLQVNYPRGNTILLDGEAYHLLQFHFHTPSEHTLASQPAPMEIHLVHQSDEGNLAVLSVMVQQGQPHPRLAALWQQAPSSIEQRPTIGHTIPTQPLLLNPGDLLPSDPTALTYVGSLTTPPCREGVRWYVMATPITASDDQMAEVFRRYGANARSIQPRHDRPIQRAG